MGRSPLVVSGLLFAAGLLAAAPVPPGSTPPGRTIPDPRPDAAAQFAEQLMLITHQVVQLYVRPVTREDLLYAALSGLYERGRLPVPPQLRGEIRAAAATKPSPRLTSAPTGLPIGDQQELLALLRRVAEDVGRAEALRGQDLLPICCRALTRSLDPHSGIVTLQEQRRGIGLDEDEREGTGLEMDGGPGSPSLAVKQVVPGSPAQKAGLRPGDEITGLDGKPIRNLAVADLQHLLEPLVGRFAPLDPTVPPPPPQPPRPMRVTFRRPGAKAARTVTLERERFHPETVLGVRRRADNSWDYLLDRSRGVAHVRLAALSRGTAAELQEIVTGLQKRGARGLILDLRWCPGGWLPEAVEAAGLFLGEGTVATVKMRNRPDEVYRSTNEGKVLDLPLVVLVNADTSGGAELIAAALQDHRRAIVIGQRTRGKGSVQNQLPLGPNLKLKLTTGTFLRPGGKNLHRFPDSKSTDDWGIRPDREFRISPDLSRALRDWWLQQTLRPGTSNERLPLDDPAADTPRQAALEALREGMKKVGPGT